jgi:hypothetical protein
MATWRQDGLHLLLGLTLATVFFGVAAVVGGLLILLLSAFAPSSIRDAMGEFSQLLQAGLLIAALLEIIAWYVLPRIGFVHPVLARRMTTGMAATALFMMVSLLFSL